MTALPVLPRGLVGWCEMPLADVAASVSAGLGAAAARSLQAEFDEMAAVLELAADALQASQQQLAAVAAAAAAGGALAEPAAALAAVRNALEGPGASGASSGGDLMLPALRARLAEWQQLVRSHQDPTRLRRWAAPGVTAAAPTP